MKKKGLLAVITLVLILGIGMTAKAASSIDAVGDIDEKQYVAMEEQYLDEARMILLEKGCKNAGITLTYVSDAQGSRNYTVTIHHSRLDKMEKEELSLLKGRLQESGEKILFAQVSFKQL